MASCFIFKNRKRIRIFVRRRNCGTTMGDHCSAMRF
ncbi:hypothetical protein B4U79_05573 [Dinothrombium tinctorium]|uniref:Uncharacterized protein n=1 Tax=Dinothrombium tinctorium TaxID=1965070 RepID=A0A3S3PFZ6_9ACAR|nr:hypothetical protein B4U79_05573 [Dinothrombium tinctorium]